MSRSSIKRSTLIELTVFLAIILASWADDMIPYFILEPSSSVVSQDSPVNLSCRVHPPSSVIKWKLNNQFIMADNSYGIKLFGDDLYLPMLTSDIGDTSEFRCVAETEFGAIVSKPAIISKAVLRRFEEQGDRHLNVSVGSNLVIPCQPPVSRPKAKIMFKINNTIIIDKDTDHYQILPSGNLLIIRVTSNDQGEYQCMAQNKLRNRTHTAKHRIHLHVLHTEVPTQEPAVIMPSTELQAVVGEDVVLECSAVGNPQPLISWEKYGGTLQPDRTTIVYGNLYLSNVTREDEGTYLCKAHNGLNFLMQNGLKARVLAISVPPKVEAVTPSVNVSLGGHIELECDITGAPKPHVVWLHNGNPLKSFYGHARLVIRHAVGASQGLYQCFAENNAGIDYASMRVDVDVTKRDSGSLTLSDQNVTKTPLGVDAMEVNNSSAGQENRRRQHKKGNRKKNGKKKKRTKDNKRRGNNKYHDKLVPPNRPEVNQLSDNSVMLNWTVPENGGLKITFFRVQYKQVAPKKGNWKTDDAEIASHIRMHEVNDLKPRATYKFRIAAVYSNNDNAHGPNSEKFELKADPEPYLKPPDREPTIVEVFPIAYENNIGLNMKWQLSTLSTAPIEGFYIYYKPFHADDEDLKTLTLLEASTRSVLLNHLQPNTEYLIKMQSFNGNGNSPYSNQVVRKTTGLDGKEEDPKIKDKYDISEKDDTETSPSGPKDTFPNDSDGSTRTGTQSSSEKLYLILGIVVGVMMLLLIIFILMCLWKQRQQRMMMDAMNEAVRNKYQDPSQRIYSDSLRKKMMNGGLGGLNGVNGTIANGHIPRNYHKMNINVNPLSQLDSLSTTDGSTHYSPSTFHPNGTVPGHHRASDNNCNNINQSKSLENSLQHLNHYSTGDNGDSETMGGGESLANPPSPVCNNVPIGHNNSEVQERRSISNRSCDHTSCDPCDSSLSYDDTGGVNSSGRHRKRRRRTQDKEQTMKDQATNTDLSSNDGTMDMAEYNKAISSSQDSGQMSDSYPPSNSETPAGFAPYANAV